MTGGANFLQSLGWAVLNSLWQMAILWVLYQLITGLFRKTRASAKASLATGLMIAGFAWFLFTFLSVYGSGSAGEMIAASAVVNGENNPELNRWLQQSLPVASVIYLLLLFFPVTHFVRNWRYVQVIRKYGLSRIQPEWKIFVANIAGHMGIRRKVQIWVSEFVSSPVTVGFLKPVILVPLAAINHLTPQQLEAVLLHELSHIRRYDYLLNIVLQFIHTILYYNPFARAFLKIVEKEREKSCDEMVLQFQYNSHEYASALLTLEKEGQQPKTFTLAAAGKTDLLTRVELILGVHKKPVLSFNRLAGFMAGLLCIIALQAILIVSRPSNGSRATDFASLKNVGDFFRYSRTAEFTAPPEEATKEPVENLATVVNPVHLDRWNDDKEIKPEQPQSETAGKGFMASAFSHPDVIPASLMEFNFAALGATEKEEVKKAIEQSKTIISNSQWKSVEKTIADVFTSREKMELKKLYQSEVEKMNWKTWENKLAQAYDNINWNNLEQQLDLAVSEIRLDSIQLAYNIALSKISELQSEMCEQKIESIPDTEINMQLLESKKSEIRKEMNRIRNVRAKKVVHL